MLGLMQDWPLTVDRILDHASAWHGDREVVTRSVRGPIVRTTYREIHGRAKKLSNVLLQLGIAPGDRVATLAWNSARHLEAWYAIMGIGAVCHTLNPRLFADQLCYIINHAGDRVILADKTFLPMLAENRARMPLVERFIVFADADDMEDVSLKGALCSEVLIAGASADCAWGGFDEHSACGLCYTSGTTGNPKGVLYSHRSNFLQALITLPRDVMSLSVTDTVLLAVPMFHANAWGLAFSGVAVGAKMVMPGPQMDGASVLELLESEKVTFSAGVPTVWQILLAHLQASGARPTTLRRIVTGGSAMPEALVRTFHEDYGIEMIHAWGMTESSASGTSSIATPDIAARPLDERIPYLLKQGRPLLGVEMRLTDDDDAPVPHDGTTKGRLGIRGPFIAREYYDAGNGSILDDDGFFDTGDICTIDPAGYMQITDRAKDVIKSGGEWISSIEIENAAAGHPKAEMTAVIGIAHPKWDERPLLLVKLRAGESATAEEFLQFLSGKIAKWCMPDEVRFVDDIPLGATGKIDKKLIRQRFEGHILPTAGAASSA
ncbi:MAG: medium-chain-fatty-acid--CoA ligase [Sphingomonas bacterium]|uniref:long-chain-fatty-acid--CoA ligase n=1 Tax=Sphingomonas bacterium TaxID=1895847 RepID=UPI002624B20F|nr:long-chain-fatty-acid--CoA ligase [Sphingomonas bacterium]MDB5705898.1 medium-chain-fatty-acid--CoA ligase [Sphingomonas bacterium]